MFRLPAVRQTALFLAIAYFLDVALVVALPHAHINVLIAAFIPAIAVGILTFTANPRGSRRALWAGIGLGRAGRTGRSAWSLVLGIPVLLLTMAYGVAVAVGAVDLQNPVPSQGGALGFASYLAITLVMGTVIIMGEEIGYRGYVLPRLQQVTDRRRAALITGFVHSLSHLPLILIATTYDTGGSRWFVAPSVVVGVTCAGVFYAYIRDLTGSVWPVAIAHNVVNTVFDLGVLATVATGSGVSVAYIAGESGLATMGSAVIVAGYLLLRGRGWRTDRQTGLVAATGVESAESSDGVRVGALS